MYVFAKEKFSYGEKKSCHVIIIILYCQKKSRAILYHLLYNMHFITIWYKGKLDNMEKDVKYTSFLLRYMIK